ncbi:AMT1-3, partial [Symbiodinium sp. CCMP2592]
MKVYLAAALAAALTATAMSQDSPADLLRELQAQKALLEEQRKELKQMTETQESMAGAMDSAWLVLCGALVMFMHAGFAMLETGCCRAKNASNVLMKNLVNVSVGTLGWWMFGWAFAYGSQAGAFIGTDGFFGLGFYTKDASGNIVPVECEEGDGNCQSTMLSWFFQWAFCTAGATIVSGCVAERVKSPTYAFFAFCMTSFIYPVVVAWTWGGGWLASIFDVGYMDFAGSGVVHFTGGVCGLAGTVILGPRRGRFENPDEFEYHNIPLVVLGTFALWFGWYGFNPGSTLSMHDKEMGALAAQVAMNTTLSAATCGITVFLLKFVLVRKYDVGALCNGILSGLVSITAGCGNMECGSAVLTGFIGAFFYQAASSLLVRLKIDDPVDASAVHGACGIWGLLAAGLFDWGKGFDHYHGWSGFGCMTGDDGACRSGLGGAAIGAQIVMILAIIAWAGTLSTLSFLILKFSGLLRIGEDIEKVGYDMHSHSPPKAYAFSGNDPKSSSSEESGPLDTDDKEETFDSGYTLDASEQYRGVYLDFRYLNKQDNDQAKLSLKLAVRCRPRESYDDVMVSIGGWLKAVPLHPAAFEGMHACFGWLVPAGTLPEAIDSSTKHLADVVHRGLVQRPHLPPTCPDTLQNALADADGFTAQAAFCAAGSFSPADETWASPEENSALLQQGERKAKDAAEPCAGAQAFHRDCLHAASTCPQCSKKICHEKALSLYNLSFADGDGDARVMAAVAELKRKRESREDVVASEDELEDDDLEIEALTLQDAGSSQCGTPTTEDNAVKQAAELVLLRQQLSELRDRVETAKSSREKAVEYR